MPNLLFLQENLGAYATSNPINCGILADQRAALGGDRNLGRREPFLEHYLPVYNRRVAVAPAQPADLHRPTPPIREMEGCLCLKTTRCVRKDFTMVHEGQRYQIRTTDGRSTFTRSRRGLGRWRRPNPCSAPTAQ